MTQLGGAQLKTFSLGFDEAGYSEADAAAANAAHLGTSHHASVLSGQQVADEIPRIIAALDQPTGDGINTYYVSQAARAGGVTVALSGLGGDELFGGYPSFRHVAGISRWLPVWRALPSPLRNAVLRHWERGDTRHRKLADTLRHGLQPAALALLQRRIFAESTRRSLLSPDAMAAYAPHPAEAALADQLPAADHFAIASAAELRGYMTDVLLRDSDVMSMRHSLELRVPFVDRPLVTWLARQPTVFKSTPHRPKAALAEAVRDLLPPALLTRAKRGFTLPFAQWMRGPLRPFLDETFSSASVNRSGLFSAPAVSAFWQGFLANNDPREWPRVWSLALLIAFINRPQPAAA
jgi:asparagine synthase (glutamine-hydrolysing)